MLTLDKIKVILPLDTVVLNTTHSDWRTTYAPNEDGEITLQRLTYGSQKETKTRHRPHMGYTGKHKGINYIDVNIGTGQIELVITGKILNNPAQLISIRTIEDVWNKVNDTALLYIYAIHVSPPQLLSADITADCVMSSSPSVYTNLISRYYVGKDFKEAKEYTPNIQLQHRAKTAKYSRTLTGYDKNLESEENTCFQPNTFRLELRLNSFNMLRKYLSLPKGDITLLDALQSKENVIYNVFQELLKDIRLSPAMQTAETPAANMTTETRATIFAAQELSFNERAIFARLKELSFSLTPLEAELRGEKNAARKLQPYREVFTRWQGFTADSCNDIMLLRELINKLKTPTIQNTISQTISEYA